MSQTHIAFNPDGSVRHWEYSAETAHVQLVRLLARLDLPIRVGETAAFADYIKIAKEDYLSVVGHYINADW